MRYEIAYVVPGRPMATEVVDAPDPDTAVLRAGAELGNELNATERRGVTFVDLRSEADHAAEAGDT